MAYKPKALSEQEVFNTLKAFHENQNRKTLAVSKVNVPTFKKLITKSKHLVMNVYDNGSATVIRKAE